MPNATEKHATKKVLKGKKFANRLITMPAKIISQLSPQKTIICQQYLSYLGLVLLYWVY